MIAAGPRKLRAVCLYRVVYSGCLLGLSTRVVRGRPQRRDQKKRDGIGYPFEVTGISGMWLIFGSILLSVLLSTCCAASASAGSQAGRTLDPTALSLVGIAF